MRLSGPQIICTLGPACSNIERLREMARAGMTVLRVNCSHQVTEQTTRLTAALRTAEPDVAVLFDLQGPKVRLAPAVREQPVRVGQPVCFVDAGAAAFPHLPGVLMLPLVSFAPFSRLAGVSEITMKDGTMAFTVEADRATDGFVLARTRLPGMVRGEKAVNVPGLLDGTPALTAEDRKDLELASRVRADAVMLSFASTAEDMADVRSAIAMTSRAWKPAVWAKVETRSAIRNLGAISKASDALLIGRGDLWVEVGPLDAPAVQSQVLRRAKRDKKPCYVATQVLESMRTSAVPTRAETRDIYLTLKEGAAGFMLTAETSVGQHPLAAIAFLRQMIERHGPR